MKQFFKNRFFYIMTVLALLFTIVPSVFYSMGVTFVLRDAVCTILSPAQKLFNYAADAIEGFAAYFYKFDSLVEENNSLREQLAELQAQVYDSAELVEMNEWLTDFLDMKTKHTDFHMLPATVTGRESGNYSKILKLDVGSDDGVEVNMPVVTSEGIVGRITEVGYNWSNVTTIVEPQSAVGAYIERTGDSGICEGEFSTSADGICRLSYLPKDAEIEVGDRILSTGYGSVYPRGLVIGYVDSITENSITRSTSVNVKCIVDFSQLSRVMIITEYKEYSK